jgi:hypothetical protein
VPDPYERHARTKDLSGWESQNPRSARRVAATEPEVKRPPAKKDPSLCKAQHWKGPHTPVFRIRQYGRQKSTCKWGPNWGKPEPRWHCAHEEVCSGCGKVLSVFVENRCPDFHEITEGEQKQITEKIEQWALRRLARPRPVIDGPQGYRKRKA